MMTDGMHMMMGGGMLGGMLIVLLILLTLIGLGVTLLMRMLFGHQRIALPTTTQPDTPRSEGLPRE